jgi:hypothetical protein
MVVYYYYYLSRLSAVCLLYFFMLNIHIVTLDLIISKSYATLSYFVIYTSVFFMVFRIRY